MCLNGAARSFTIANKLFRTEVTLETDNAFWDGQQMVFGDGDPDIFEDFTKSEDVIGHGKQRRGFRCHGNETNEYRQSLRMVSRNTLPTSHITKCQVH
jgi:hypothetical protein